MSSTELYEALNYVNHSRAKRMEMATLISNNPKLVAPLLQIAFKVNDPISSKACWVMEFAAKENLPYIYSSLDNFTQNLEHLHLESSVRPMAKICEYLCIAYFKKKDTAILRELRSLHLEKISAACFDWLIGDYKVAPKAYAMTCLLLLGRTFDWINPELKMVLENDYTTGSAAYKARARITLAKLKQVK